MDTVPQVDCIHVKNKSNLSFKEMWNRKDLSDIKLCCNQTEFYVHRFLLAACSPYFKRLFEKNPEKNLNIILKKVKGDDLRRVLLYMYHGSVLIKNDDIQGFCEILELFLMSVPDDVVVSASENEFDSASESDNESDSEYESDDGKSDTFVQSIRDAVTNLNEENVHDQSNFILNQTEMEENYIDIVINIILQAILQPKPTDAANLFVLLVKHICIQNGTNQFRDDTIYFGERLRIKVLNLFAGRDRNCPTEPPSLPCSNEENVINALDKQVNLMESIQSHCSSVRYQRLAHFIGHLVLMELISGIDDISQLNEENLQIKNDLLGKRHTDRNCCNFTLPQAVDDIFKDQWYQNISALENHMFWTRSKVTLRSVESQQFEHIGRASVIQKQPRKQKNDGRKRKKKQKKLANNREETKVSRIYSEIQKKKSNLNS